MPHHEKRVQRILRNPQSVSFSEIDIILREEGWAQRKPGSGSHFTYVKEGSFEQITIPYRRPHIGVTYVKRVIEILGLEEKYGG
jgi:hypothetical protein